MATSNVEIAPIARTLTRQICEGAEADGVENRARYTATQMLMRGTVTPSAPGNARRRQREMSTRRPFRFGGGIIRRRVGLTVWRAYLPHSSKRAIGPRAIEVSPSSRAGLLFVGDSAAVSFGNRRALRYLTPAN